MGQLGSNTLQARLGYIGPTLLFGLLLGLGGLANFLGHHEPRSYEVFPYYHNLWKGHRGLPPSPYGGNDVS